MTLWCEELTCNILFFMPSQEFIFCFDSFLCQFGHQSALETDSSGGSTVPVLI